MPSLLNGVSFIVVIPLLLFRVGEIRAMDETWSYDRRRFNHPWNWKYTYPNCGGVKQSPINIKTRKVLYDPLLPRFDLSHYNRTDGVYMQLLNKDGHTVQVEYTGQGIYIKDGGLPTSYKLDQFHFHWGAIDTRGSENIIDNIHFPMELHIVHRQNSSNSFRNAASYPSGLAVIGFFFKVVAEDNERLNRHLLRFLSMVIHTDQMAHIPAFALSEILPDLNNLDYYRFDGSLTYPPCHESVIWSVATEFIPISKSQLNMFRNLQTRDQNPMVDNFRPPQNLNQRRVYTTKNLNQRREYTGRSLGVGITAGEGWVTTSQIILLAYTGTGASITPTVVV